MAIFRTSGKEVMGKEIGGFGKKERREWAMAKSRLDESRIVSDENKVKKMAELFEKRVAQERARLGLGHAVI